MTEAEITQLIAERDAAEEAADKLAAMVLGENIDWPDHPAKWAEALTEAHNQRFNAQWYPLTELLPEKGKTVLFVWDRGNETIPPMRTGRYDGSLLCVPGGNAPQWKTQPTHWRELPTY